MDGVCVCVCQVCVCVQGWGHAVSSVSVCFVQKYFIVEKLNLNMSRIFRSTLSEH